MKLLDTMNVHIRVIILEINKNSHLLQVLS